MRLILQYVVPNTLLVGDLVMEERYQITDRQCLKQSKASEVEQNCCPKHVELNWTSLISNFRHVLNVLCYLLGDSLTSEFYMPTFLE